MAETAENRRILVAKLPLFDEMNLEQARKTVISLEVRPALDETPIPPAAWVVGPSLKKIYEDVTGKEYSFGGPKAERIAVRVLTQYYKVVPHVISEQLFTHLVDNVREKMDAKQFNLTMQALLGLPFEVAVEKAPQA